jgi:hypothetical protein
MSFSQFWKQQMPCKTFQDAQVAGFETKPYLLKMNVPSLDWGIAFQAKCEVTLPFQLTQFALNRKIEHQVFLSNSGSDLPTSLDMHGMRRWL